MEGVIPAGVLSRGQNGSLPEELIPGVTEKSHQGLNSEFEVGVETEPLNESPPIITNSTGKFLQYTYIAVSSHKYFRSFSLLFFLLKCSITYLVVQLLHMHSLGYFWHESQTRFEEILDLSLSGSWKLLSKVNA